MVHYFLSCHLIHTRRWLGFLMCSAVRTAVYRYRHDGIRELPEFNAVPSDGIDWSH